MYSSEMISETNLANRKQKLAFLQSKQEGPVPTKKTSDLTIAWRTKKPGYFSLYFTKIDESKQKECLVHNLVLGCELLTDPITKKFQVLHIPEASLGCELWEDAMMAKSLQFQSVLEKGTDCFVISLCLLGKNDRVKPLVDYLDSIVFDTQNDKIVRIEIIGASEFLVLDI